ncbi:MAG: class I SAM-dependent methyltransferase [Proteobacteria bacterium]|nr:class I SAM-dependent methyltransferase [Pseudomonadota bacterium]
MTIFDDLEAINSRPGPFEFYTASDLWTDDHTSKQMLAFHLNGEVDLSSRKASFIDRSVEWIASRFQVGPETRIGDFGCGPGLYASRLAGKGARVTGIDFSERSIRHARDAATREGLSIDYVRGNYLEYETDVRFELVMMIMCDFCALSPIQRKEMLRRFQTVLEPGGAVLLDVYSLNAFEARQEAVHYESGLLDGFWSPDPYYGFLNTFKYDREKVVLDKYTIIEAGGTRTVYNWLQYFSPEVLESEFRAGGFEVEAWHADVAGAPFDPGAGEFAVAARKR